MQPDTEKQVPKHRKRKVVLLTAVALTGTLGMVSTARALDLGGFSNLLGGSNIFGGGNLGNVVISDGTGLTGENDPLSGVIGNAAGNLGDGIIQNGQDLLSGLGGLRVGGFNLGSIFISTIGNYASILQAIYHDWLNQTLGQDLGGVISENTGAVGVSDPMLNKQQINDQIGNNGLGNGGGLAAPRMQQIDNFNINPVALSQSLSNEADRGNAKASAMTVLGKMGQEQMANETQAAQQTLTQNWQIARSAQNLDVTQDVMKSLSLQVANQSALQSGTYVHTMQMQQQLAHSNQLLSNTSEALDELNRTQHAENISGAMSILEKSSSIYLPGMNPPQNR